MTDCHTSPECVRKTLFFPVGIFALIGPRREITIFEPSRKPLRMGSLNQIQEGKVPKKHMDAMTRIPTVSPTSHSKQYQWQILHSISLL